MPPETFAIVATDLTRRYGNNDSGPIALARVSLTVARGEVVAVVGPSGSGKSTLLAILGGLDQPDDGTVQLVGVELDTLRGSERARFLRRTCGFIVQGLALLPQATAAENVEVPLLLDGVPAGERRERVAAALERVGISALAGKLPDELSGGEQQRVSIARALVHKPAVVLADEPTGSLDSANAQVVTGMLVARAADEGAAVLIVTHDKSVAAHADRIITMHSGQVA